MRPVILLFVLAVSRLAVGHEVCVIGGGVSGAFSTHWLAEFPSEFSISLFEKNLLGGRVRSVIEGEAGASIGVLRNKYFVEAVGRAGLNMTFLKDQRWGVLSGNEMLIQQKSFLETICNVLWRWGFSMQVLQWEVSTLLSKFDLVYKLQDRHEVFPGNGSGADMWRFMGLDRLSAVSFRVALKRLLGQSWLATENQINSFISEFCAGVSRNNYNQNTTLNALAGMIGMAGTTSRAFKVTQGIQTMIQRLIGNSGAQVFHHTVETITAVENGFELRFDGTMTRFCDDVIIAAPLEDAMLLLPEGITVSEHRPYQKVFTTFVTGVPDYVYFGVENARDIPQFVLTSEYKPSLFKSMSVISESPDGIFHCKFFSASRLNKENLAPVFLPGFLITSQFEWSAYPEYNPPDEFPDFELAPGLFYLNSVESGASAIEIMAVSARNAALSIRKRHRRFQPVDKDEL